jgi:vitamin B12 transporter
MRKGWILPLPLLMAVSPLWGQSKTVRDCAHWVEDQASFSECEILVTGSLPDPVSDSANAVIRLTPDTDPSVRIETQLSSIPSLQQFRRSDARSANPTSHGVTMRGLGGNASSRALLILDGVPQSDPFGGWVAWPGYDAVRMAEITVRRGSGSVTDGPGSLAGTIELISDTGLIVSRGRDFADSDYIEGSVSGSDRSDIAARISARQKLGGGTVGISASYASGDGFIPIVRSQRGAADRKAPYEQMGIALRAVALLSESTELQAGVRAFSDERDRGFIFSDNQNSGVDASLRLVNRSDGWQWSALGYVQIRDFANRFGAVAADRNSVSLTLDQYSVPSTGLGARFEVRPPVGDNAELRIGGDWRRTIGQTKENFFFTGTVPDRNRIAGGQTNTLGGFAEASFKPVEALTLTAGGRADFWRTSGGVRKEVNIGGTVRSDEVFAGRSGWEGTGRAGFAFQASDAFKLRGAAYLGWRLPTLNELYRPFRVGTDATAANELLSPERLKGTELGVEYVGGGLTLSATAFVNRLDNAIANVTQGTGPGNFPGVGFVAAGGSYRRRENLDSIDSKGVELDASLDLQPFTLRTGYAYVDAEVGDNGLAAALDGFRPAQVPKHFGNIALEYDSSDVDASATLRYVGGQFEDDLNSQRLDDALTLGGSLSYRLSDQFYVTLRGENLFDTRVEAAISGSGIIERATPRTIWFGFRYVGG